MNKNKDRALLIIILTNIIFTFIYYIVNRNSSVDKLYVIPVISIAVLIEYIVFKTCALREKEFNNIEKYYFKTLIISVTVLIVIQYILLYSYFNAGIDSYKLVSLLISYMLIYIGNIMPQMKQNSIIGIRTKKALTDKVIWKEVNKVGGITLVITGIILFVVSLVLSGKILILTLLVVLIIWSLINDIYSNHYCRSNRIDEFNNK